MNFGGWRLMGSVSAQQREAVDFLNDGDAV